MPFDDLFEILISPYIWPHDLKYAILAGLFFAIRLLRSILKRFLAGIVPNSELIWPLVFFNEGERPSVFRSFPG